LFRPFAVLPLVRSDHRCDAEIIEAYNLGIGACRTESGAVTRGGWDCATAKLIRLARIDRKDVSIAWL
jgi:hypothetical protein